jgi:hypothetical protein
MISISNITLLQNKFSIERIFENEYSSLAQILLVWSQSIDDRGARENDILSNCQSICNIVYLCLIENKVDDVYVCKYKSEIEGFMVIYNSPDRENLHINYLCSNPKNIRRLANAVLGVGGAMLDATKRIAQQSNKIFVDVMPYRKAMQFYARNDFEEDEDTKGSMFFFLESDSDAAS